MKHKKLIKKAAKALDELNTLGIALTYHCDSDGDHTSCWQVEKYGEFEDYALIRVDGTVWL